MKPSMESFIMNGKSIAGLSLASFLSLILLGCGGGEEAVAPADVDTEVATEPEIKGKSMPAKMAMMAITTSSSIKVNARQRIKSFSSARENWCLVDFIAIGNFKF